MSLLVVFALVSLVTAASATDTAHSWKRSTIQWQYCAYGAAYDGGGSPTTCKVKLNNCGAFYTYFDVQPNAKSITFNYAPSGSGGTWSQSVLSLAPTIYNGIAINLLSAGKITSVTIDPATNMSGFNSSDLSFTDKQIQVNWATLSFNSSTIVKLDVTFSKGSELQGHTFGDNPPRPTSE